MDHYGVTADVVLGYDSLQKYEMCGAYMGATCGRYGNRIGHGRFELDGVVRQLDTNEGRHHLHGGSEGFDAHLWGYELDEHTNAVRFTLSRPDGDQGYPGGVDLSVEYRLDDAALHVHMVGVTDAPTIINMVHHSYWNLAGHDSGAVLDHTIQVVGDCYTPVDADLIPTGAIEAVENTPFDLRTPTRIGERIHDIDRGEITVGYDHNWVLTRRSEPSGRLRRCAMAIDVASGRRLDLRTTEPGLQFYTGGHLNAQMIGKSERPYGRFAGFALETQRFPDSPNHPQFPSAVLRPGDRYDHRMVFEFSTVP